MPKKLFFAATLLGLIGGSVAQTPDGETPANEGVCDELIGGTPGLYGLCVAYCEAQDLDEFGQPKPSNTRLLEIYEKKRRSGDADMPCIRVPCPCWTSAELTDLAQDPGAECAFFGAATTLLVNRGNDGFAEIFPFQERGICAFFQPDPRIDRRFNLNGPMFTDAQWDSCVSQIEEVCPSD